MKLKHYFKLKKRLQNFKKCIGCQNLFELNEMFIKCPECGGNKFIPVTEYIREK